MAMNPEIKARWVAKLRSGEYEQGRGRLNRDGAMCCLGVLCDLYSKEHGHPWGENGTFMHACSLPAAAVQHWAGLPDENPYITVAGREAALAAHNDGDQDMRLPSRTFAEIADAIEAQL